MVLLEILKTLRPHQWVKNLFVLAPLVFAEQAESTTNLGRAAAAFVLFSLLSGCVYILNDLVDVEADRKHPTKRHRPIPSGRLPVPAARRAFAVLLLGVAACAFLLGTGFAALGLAYFTLNVGYSLSLKHVPFVDVLTIATGFLLRIFAGAAAIDVPMSAWLAACTFLLAAYLGLGKRKHELLMVGREGSKQRKVLDRYSIGPVKGAMAVLAAATAASYAAYVFAGQTLSSFSPRDLVWTLPCVAIGVGRFYVLTNRTDDGRSPTDLMLRDPLFMANLAVYGAVVVWVIYLRHLVG